MTLKPVPRSALIPRSHPAPRAGLDLAHALAVSACPLAHNLRRRGMSVETFAVRLNLPLGRALAYVEGRQSLPLELWRRLSVEYFEDKPCQN